MKKVIFLIALIIGISAAAMAQLSSQKEKKENSKMELKDHVCTDACHTSGHCVYAHGEKGHTCTSACAAAPAGSSAMELKDHVCTDACHTSGHCVYAHGEKGHECTDACKKK